MNFLPRSSRVTGPKMRVPIGSSFAVSSTAALWSKRMRELQDNAEPSAADSGRFAAGVTKQSGSATDRKPSLASFSSNFRSIRCGW